MAHAIGFLGAGQMATALARGWIAAGLLDVAKSLAADPFTSAQQNFAAATGIRTSTPNADLLAAYPILVLAVKPQTLASALAEFRPEANQLVISIVAGATLDQLAGILGLNCRIVRVMPNTPALVGASASGYAAGPHTTPDDIALVGRLFNAVGSAFAVPEHLLNAVTGLSGSGPAYVYLLIEALADGGVKMGLPRDIALKLAAQTVFGSAKMVLETGSHPAALKDAVASPGGTTIAGLHALERAGFRAAAMDAVEAATQRAEEFGKK
jgi:pyrroline-5-carboxylate reductase